MKRWISRYALTRGVYQASGEIPYGKAFYESGSITAMSVGEFHKYKPDAIAAAEQMKIKKLASLDKQIKKVSLLEFN